MVGCACGGPAQARLGQAERGREQQNDRDIGHKDYAESGLGERTPRLRIGKYGQGDHRAVDGQGGGEQQRDEEQRGQVQMSEKRNPLAGGQSHTPDRQYHRRALQGENPQDGPAPESKVRHLELRPGEEADQPDRQALHHGQILEHACGHDSGDGRSESDAGQQIAHEAREPRVVREGAEGIGREEQNPE